MKRSKCAACGRWATRRKLDHATGRMLWLCDRCPSPREIRQRAEAVQAGWDDAQRLARWYDCPREVAVMKALSWDVPTAAPVYWLDPGERELSE